MTRRQALGWLMIVAFVWGSTFTVTKQVLTLVSPLMFIAVRFSIATIVIAGALRGARWPEIRAGLVLGLLFWTGFVFQTVGLDRTTPSRSAFITSLSGILVPLVAFGIHQLAPGKRTLLGIVVATAGIYLLTAPDAGGINAGDTLTLGCAFLFAGHIVAAAHFVRRFDPIRLLAVQLGLSAVLSFAAAPLLETPRFEPTVAVAVTLVLVALTGLWSFYMQLRAQREISSSDAALVFLLEPVVATAISFVVLHERFTPTQWIGSALTLAALAIPVIGERRGETSTEAAMLSRPEIP